MSNPQTASAGAPTWSDDVIRRVVRAWAAGYGMSLDDFAAAIDMNARTFKRRLAASGPRQAFSGGEIARMAEFMSRVSGDRVSIADLYAGRVSVFAAPTGPLAQLAELRTFNPKSPTRAERPVSVAKVIDLETWRRRVA